MKKNIFILLLFITCYCSNAFAQHVPEKLDSMFKRTLDSMRTRMCIKSLSAAVQLNDTASWAKAIGISSLSPAVDADAADAYLIGSVTKTMTSACILKLAEEGKLNLDDSLYEWLDPFKNVNPNISIRQLLRHQSGLFDVLANPDCNPALMSNIDSIWSAKDLITAFTNAPTDTPGGKWNYCNTNYMLLGMIIEKATGKPFYEELRSGFFNPLHLNTIAIPAFETLTSPVAHVWLDITGDGVLDDAHDFYMSFKSLNSTAGACGGYFSTAQDVSKWMRSYMRGDLHSAATMAEAKTTITAPGSQGGLYGLGLMKNKMDGLVAYGHGGDLAYSASSWYFPERDISISVLGNDAGKTSWALLPVVEALLKTYNNWKVTTGIPELDLESMDIKAFPAPFSKKLTVSIRHKAEAKNWNVVLVNVSGQKIASALMQNNNQHETQFEFENLSDIGSGIYFVHIYAAEKLVKTIKVLK